MLQANIRARSSEGLVHMGCEFSRYVQLPPEFADIGHAQGGDGRVANVDLLGSAERERLIAEIGIGEWLEEGASVWSHDRQHGVGRGHVGGHDRPITREILGQPVEVTGLGGRASDDEEAVLASSTNLSEEKQDILDKLLFRIKAVLKAKSSKYVLMNVPNDKITLVSSILPVLKSPTVLPLAEEGWSSLHSVIDEEKFWEVIDELKEAGAEGILIVPIDKIVL